MNGRSGDAHQPRSRRTKTFDVHPQGDGVYSFVARLTDEAWNGEFGGPDQVTIHDIEVRGRLEGPELTVTALTVTPLELPYTPCPRVAPAAGALVGQALRGGWRKAVLAVLGGTAGCTHQTTLLLGLAEITTHVIFLEMNARTPYDPVTRVDGTWMSTGLDIEPGLVDVCHGLSRTGEVLLPILRRSDMVNERGDAGPTAV
ncbi:DUF2889 domain-containing protein [Sporichthya polymorpha]|uniref:DUF2889 domain-containing protein n=1 Tax=Sporichthya polymorpha TaxID=35751 RepID=UPI00037E5D41|nr:DUF2889 domain-containing protein [Sporichthya polymorpha]